MLLNIISNNYMEENFVVINELNTVQQNTTSNNQTSLVVNLEPKQNILNKETIVQLQEVQDYSILQITSKKEEIDFNGTPSLEWLKGKNDVLYNEISRQLPTSIKTMKDFKRIVEENKNSETISHKDWNRIKIYIKSRENWIIFNKENRSKTDDTITHKVLDYMLPKTLQRIEVMKQYLSTKTKEPEILFELKNVDVKQTVDISTNDNSCKKANDLLNFLVKDLEWYKWFLEDKKQPFISYSLQYLQLKRSITHSLTVNETTQVV